MKPNESSSASNSGATSATAPTKREPSNKPPGALSEAEYLARQAEDARLAMARAWGDLKHSLASGADVRLWAQRYPWIATSTALAAGVALGYALTPRDRDEFQEMWEKLKEKLSGAGKDGKAVYVEAAGAKPAQPHPSLLGTILREAVKSVVPLVTSMVGAAIGGAEATSHNGHDEEPNPS